MRRAMIPVLLFGIGLNSAFAQSSPPLGQEIVVTATRVPTPVLDIPAGVSVIDRHTIEVNDYTNLVQALSAVPGIRVAQSGGPGGNASVFVRGTNSNQVLVLRDGMPLNDASDASGAFNFGVDTLADVERIEVIRGPMAALYGSGAIGGVINLITRQGRGAGPQFSGDLAGGYPRQILGNAIASGVNGALDYAAVYEGQSQRGFDVTPKRESIYSGVPDGFRAQIGTLNLGYTVVEGTRLSLLLRARTSTFGFNALGFPTFDNANSTGNVDSLLGRVGVTSRLFSGIVETGLFLGRLQEDRQYTQRLDPRDPNLASNDSRYHAYRTDLQWNNTVHLSDLLNVAALSATDLTFGYEYTGDSAKVRVNSSTLGFPFSQNANAHMEDNAGYAGIQGTVWERLKFTGQIRQDAVLNNTPFTWRTGAVVDAHEIRSHFHAAYGTAFRAPSLFDRYGVDSIGFVGNPNLKPERSQGWEIGFVTDAPMFGRADFASLGATYFNNQVQNLIITTFAPVYTAVNIGSAHLQGVETELTLRPARWMTATLAYTYTVAQDADTQSQLPRRPQNTVSANVTATPLPRLTIAPELLYTGRFHDFLVDDQGFATSDIVSSKPGLILNLTVTYQVTPQIQLYANGRNLTNSHFEPVNGYATPGPSFLAGTRVRF
jgi:vitamin B12 transporter